MSCKKSPHRGIARCTMVSTHCGTIAQWEVSVVELFFGEVSVGDLCMGKCQLGNCPDTNLSVKLSETTALKSSIKRAMTSFSHTKACAKPFSLSKTTTYGFVVFIRIV